MTRHHLWVLLLQGVTACADPTRAGVDPTERPTPARLADRIVFVSSETGTWRLHAMNLDGTGRYEIPVKLKGHLASPDVSPDGSRVAFVHERAIYIVRADGSDLHRMSRDDVGGESADGDSHPRWSPDGTELAFSSSRAGEGIDVYVVAATGFGLRRVTREGEEAFLGSWSPDGRRLAYTIRREAGSRIVLVNRDGSDPVELPPVATDDAPDWSPDGLQILYQSFDERAIHVIGVDGSNDRRISPEGISEGLPRWSPDGMRIIFLDATAPDFGITVSRVDGSERRQLTAGGDSEPDWGPSD